MSLGENIRKFRIAKGMTQETLAERLYVSSCAVSKWERDECLPDSAQLPCIADELDVSLDRLFGRKAVALSDIAYNIFQFTEGMFADKRLIYARRIASLCEYSVFGFGETGFDDGQIENLLCWLNDCTGSVCNETEGGFTFGSNRSELPFCCIFPEPESGWTSVLRPDKRYCEFFEILSDERLLHTLLSLYEKPRGFSFDNDYAMREWKLDDPADVMHQLEKLRVIRGKSAKVDGAEKQIWFFLPKCGIIALFAILNEYIYHNKSFDFECSGRESPYLRPCRTIHA